MQAFVTNLENKLQMTSAPGAVPAQTGLPPPGVAYGTPLSNAQLNAVSVNVSPRRMDWLERAYQTHDAGLISMLRDPMLKNLKRNPRFEALLREMKLQD
jgi:hypothetical protein